MNNLIDNWVANVKLYPPNEIFYQKYGKEAKAEKRIQEFCEDVYRFNFPNGSKNIVGDLSAAYRDLQVLHVMGFENIKPLYLKGVCDKFLLEAKEAVKSLDMLFKKDQILQSYYQDWKIKYQDLSKEVFDMTSIYTKGAVV